MRTRSALSVVAVVATALAAAAAPAQAARPPSALSAGTPTAASPTTGAAAPGTRARGEVREIAPGTAYPLAPEVAAAQQKRAAQRRGSAQQQDSAQPRALAAGTTPPVGTVRTWLALDDDRGRLYLKSYTLQAVGDKIEVWVASDTDAVSIGTAFPAGDCRNATPGSTTVTQEQAEGLAREFDTNIYPKESVAFSVAPDRDGSGSPLSGDFDFTGAGDRIVTLVDNVRDDNFYDFPARPTYIAGFFSSQFNELLDRNVMTIDAYDWLHRTGANPPDEPAADLCSSRPARPQLYEGVFAQEYQHLLEYYQDPSEVSFLNEGMSDFAESLTGYADTRNSVAQPDSESHIYCFQGFGELETAYNPNGRDCGGPQNSLTLWGDDGDGDEMLADYGNAWSFVLYLNDHYGLPFVSRLHRDGERQGLDSVQALLERRAPGTRMQDVLHDFQTMNLVDRYVHPGGTVTGRPYGAVTSSSLRATVNLLNPRAYAKPGAAPNGADYVALRRTGATFLSGSDLRTVAFDASPTLEPLPLAWTVVDSPEGRSGPVLWSGNSSNLDAGAIASVTVPTSDPTLTYVERHLAESDYDYAYTVVSTDGGRTYTALANANTVPGPLGPALNGDAEAFTFQTFDLSAYAGQTILLGFRYVSDSSVNDGGWYVDDVTVGGVLVSDGSSTVAFRSPTQVQPVPVANMHLRLIGLNQAGRRVQITAYDGLRQRLDRAALRQFAGYPVVVAQVAYDEPTEQVQQYARYTLTVNGVVQPGG